MNLDSRIAKTQQRLRELDTGTGQLPLFSRGQRFNDGTNSQKNIKLADALAEAEETVKQTPRVQYLLQSKRLRHGFRGCYRV